MSNVFEIRPAVREQVPVMVGLIWAPAAAVRRSARCGLRPNPARDRRRGLRH